MTTYEFGSSAFDVSLDEILDGARKLRPNGAAHVEWCVAT